MNLFIRDMNPEVCAHMEQAFKDCPKVGVQHGDIFLTVVDAAVSPANSFGWMDGGIDAYYCKVLGPRVEDDVKAAIANERFGELLIGKALVVGVVGSPLCRWLIASPTMRVPGPTSPAAVYLATRAAVHAALVAGFATVAMPGMGTLTGRVPAGIAAGAMRAGYGDAMAWTAAHYPHLRPEVG